MLMKNSESAKNSRKFLIVSRAGGLSLACMIAGVIFGIPALAANSIKIPPSGTAEYTTTYAGTVHSAMTLASGKHAELREIVGLSRTTTGSSHYHGLTVRCLVYFEMTDDAPRINGNCTQMDADGDKMFQRFAAGRIEIMGGSGKYYGISGKGVITGVRYYKALGSNARQFEVHHQVEWNHK